MVGAVDWKTHRVQNVHTDFILRRSHEFSVELGQMVEIFRARMTDFGLVAQMEINAVLQLF